MRGWWCVGLVMAIGLVAAGCSQDSPDSLSETSGVPTSHENPAVPVQSPSISSSSTSGRVSNPQRSPGVSNPPQAAVDTRPLALWNEGTVHGPWRVVFNGYGTVRGNNTSVELSPKPVTSADQTRAGLAVTTATYGDVEVRATIRTHRQLRTGSAANPWEVGWLLWRYTDNDHFYAVALKPNGWELTKQDPQYPGKQRFLTTGTSPRFALGGSYNVHVTHIGNRITVNVDGKHLTTFTDNERPYPRGSVGFYCEDAHTTATGLTITNR